MRVDSVAMTTFLVALLTHMMPPQICGHGIWPSASHLRADPVSHRRQLARSLWTQAAEFVQREV